VPEAFDLQIERNASVDPGDVAEGCAGGPTGRTLLRFGLRTRNVGAGDLVLGDPGCPPCAENPGAPCANPLYVCAPAHQHAHFQGYATAELVRPDGTVASIGRKIGFCVLDLECPVGKFTCSYQGLSAGCADVYPAALPCQYVDLTGVDLGPGDYRLRVTVDPERRIDESDETNNAVEVPLPLDCDTAADNLAACRPNPFVCYGTRTRRSAAGDGRRALSAAGTFGRHDLEVGRSRELCLPAGAGPDGRNDPTTHLHAYAARERPGSERFRGAESVRVVTRLGEIGLHLGAPTTVAVPAAVAHGAAPVALERSDHTVDRFACFPAKVPRTQRAAVEPTTVVVGDRLLDPPRPVLVKKPRRFCTPIAADGLPMRLPTRSLLCFDIARPAGVRERHVSVLDVFAGRTVDLGSPATLCLPAEKNPARPVAETLEPCEAVDLWHVEARAGRTIEVGLDTAGPAGADLCTEVVCGGLELAGDDEVACTATPFGCPRVRGVARTDGPCVATVRTCGGGCLDPAVAGYVLRAAVAGEDAPPTLLVDDARAAP
jgi:hypothetical protein